MILPNKILLFLIGCTIAVPCFGACVCETCSDCGNNCSCTETKINCATNQDRPACCATNSCGEGISCDGYDCTRKEEKIKRKTLCKEGYYISQCNAADYSFENIMTTLEQQHFRLADECWALDLPTADHYKNIRALFDFSVEGMDTRIDKMDDNSKPENAGCNATASKTVLKTWLNGLSDACLENAAIGIVGIGYVCKKCPDGGITTDVTRIVGAGTDGKYTVTILKDSYGNVLSRKTAFAKWGSFHTIADCYITNGEDERGEFELEQPTPSTNPPTNKCYYSKE